MKVLKAVSSPLRLKILNFLFDKGPLSYTELMMALKLNPSRDAGKFAYHLKFLLNSDLVEADSSSKKYFLTDLGKMVLDIADKVEKRAFGQREMLVRTSHFTLEEFDVNKIAKSLIKEAKVPPELAQKTAKDAEKRLRKSKTKFITAPLVREIVNTILVERGHEDYRHKLARMGMPIYEVTELMNSKKIARNSSRIILDAGKKVFEEYTLLNIFPRDIADAHLLGAIYIKNLGSWILKPKEVIHDIRFFFEYGLNLPKISDISIKPPNNLDSALTVTLNVLLYCKKEVNSTQILESFNVFLSPFIKNNNIIEIKNSLQRFLINISQNVNTTISLDLSIPEIIKKTKTIDPKEKRKSSYYDLIEKSCLVASLIIDIVTKKSTIKPLFNPKIIIKISKESFDEKNILRIIQKAHKLAFERGNIYFENLIQEKSEWKIFSGSGIKLTNDLSGDWETDTLRTGCLGSVAINLPRIVIESEYDQNKFFDILKERFELSARALRIKYNALKQIGKSSLPFLTQKTKGDTYFRFDHCSRIINLVGFQEAVEKFSGKKMINIDSQKFAKEIVKNVLRLNRKIGRKYGKRLFPVVLPNSEASRRLAELDVEKFGVAKVKFSGSRYYPFFSSSIKLDLKKEPLRVTSESLQIKKEISGLNSGGCLYVLELSDIKSNYQELVQVTKNLVKNKWIEFFTYNRSISYCENCKKSWQEHNQKCPSCGSLSTMKTFNRFRFT
jgi:ribonucleoside-triphosphate reductase